MCVLPTVTRSLYTTDNWRIAAIPSPAAGPPTFWVQRADTPRPEETKAVPSFCYPQAKGVLDFFADDSEKAACNSAEPPRNARTFARILPTGHPVFIPDDPRITAKPPAAVDPTQAGTSTIWMRRVDARAQESSVLAVCSPVSLTSFGVEDERESSL